MGEDQFQRHVEFIVEQQAKFETNIAKLEENHARHERENREMFAKLGDIILSLANYNQQQDERIAAHDKQIAELIEHGKETDRRTKETDDRINALIGMAERFFNRDGN
ncbi:MAG: hypothetical protein AABO41_27950 [Acidobacteriota bacterium]